jgi:predicted ATPase
VINDYISKVKIKKLHIENYKSLVNVEINEPNPFTVFVGPNGSGKSNLFEAIEFGNFCYRFSPSEAINIFGINDIVNRNNINKINEKIDVDIREFNQNIFLGSTTNSHEIKINLTVNETDFFTLIGLGFLNYGSQPSNIESLKKLPEYIKYFDGFSRIFVGREQGRKLNIFDDKKLNQDASNLENVLKRILENNNTKEDIIEWLQIFIPEFEKIEIHTSALSGKNELAIFEKTIKQPLTKNLISDGTYNILALLTAIFQSDNPQFICIEEPENGLNPFVVKKLVGLFREACETKGHYIWINTHSQTLVNQLTPEELILVNKKEGATTIKQLNGTNLHGLDMDEAWLSNALGGGVPW